MTETSQGTPDVHTVQSPVSWRTVTILGIAGAATLGYYNILKQQRLNEMEAQRSIGRPSLGGPFELVNTSGRVVTDKDFHGKYTIMYFGFTHCPDICPVELDKLTTVIEKLDATRGMQGLVKPVFVTVDPSRDTVAQVREYISEFHPNMEGLTGTPDQISKVTKAYRVYFSKDPRYEEDYLVDHSIIMYLMDRNGEFVDFFGKNFTAEEMYTKVRDHVSKQQKRWWV